MGYGTSRLSLSNEHPDGHFYEITVEKGTSNLVRLHVACHNEGNGEIKNSQGGDLTPGECRALANILLGMAELAEVVE